MGYIYSETGDYESAINRGKEAVGLSVRHFGDTHYNTSRAYNDLGMMYVHAGRNDEAIAYLKQSLSIKEKRKAVDSSSVMVSKYNIANAHLQSDKPGRAVDLLEEVFAFERNSYGENNISVAITMRLLAQAYIDNNELEKVPEMLEKCTGVMENGYDDDNRRLAELYLSWSEYYLKKAAFSDSEFYAHKALDIYEALYPDDYWGVAYAKALSAFISYKQGFWTKTEKERYLSNIKVLKSQDTKRDYLVQKLEM
jgi:tetratricopeptide (TPR) repeat protein